MNETSPGAPAPKTSDAPRTPAPTAAADAATAQPGESSERSHGVAQGSGISLPHPGRTRLNRLGRSLICLLGGVFTALAYPPYDLYPIVWVALIPLIAVLWSGPARFWPSFRAGWLYGMGWYCVSFSWITEVSAVFPLLNNCFGSPADMPALLRDNPELLPLLNRLFFGLIAFLPLMALYALLPALWAGVAGRWLRPRTGAGPARDLSEATPDERRSAWTAWAHADMRSWLGSAVALGALWVCIEWLRAHFLCLGFSWNSLGSALYGGYAFAQWAEFIGTNGLSIIPASFSILLWGALRRAYLHQRGASRINRPWDFYGAVVLLMLLFLGGLIMARQYSPAGMRAASQRAEARGESASCLMLPVMAAQINLDQVEKMQQAADPAFRRRIRERYLRLTGEAFEDILRRGMDDARRNPELGIIPKLPLWVVWPESALPDHLWRDTGRNALLQDRINSACLLGPEGLPGLRSSLADRLGAAPFTLFAGGDEILLRDADGTATDAFNTILMPDGRRLSPAGMYNSLVVIPEGFDSVTTTAKQHLMPFGEYIPLVTTISWIGDAYSQLTGTQVGDGIIPGSGSDPLTLSLPDSGRRISVIPAVCYEDTVGDLIAKFVRPEPQVIVNVTNDAWFRRSACGEQQARMAAFRCIELRRPMVRAANMGVTCSIAPNGAPIDELRDADGKPWLEGYSYALLPVDLNGRVTLYARWGEWFCVVCAALVLLALLRRRLSSRASGPQPCR